jgi:hypothetical protein
MKPRLQRSKPHAVSEMPFLFLALPEPKSGDQKGTGTFCIFGHTDRPQRGTGPKKGQALFDMPTDTVVLDRINRMKNEEISKNEENRAIKHKNPVNPVHPV